MRPAQIIGILGNAGGSAVLVFGPTSDFTDPAWIPSDCSVSGQVVTKTGASPWLLRVIATIDGLLYRATFDVVAGTSTTCKILCVNQGVAAYEATFDIVAGTYSGVTSGSSASISSLGSGVFRCALDRIHTGGNPNDIVGLVVLGTTGDSLTVNSAKCEYIP